MRLSRSDCRKIVQELVATKLSDDIEDNSLELPDAFHAAHKRREKGTPTYTIPGFSKLSEAVGGFPHNGFTIITGGSGLGKSTLAGNLWVGLNALRKNIYTVPIEIGPHEFTDMLISIIAAKSRRNLTPADYVEAKQKWFPMFFANHGHVMATHESRLSHLDFLAEVYYHHKVRGVSVAFGDNWNFMLDPARGADANAENDRALHDCIVFSKKVPVHIFMIMHPRKDNAKDKTERVTSMFDIKGSSTSPQEATNVLLFNPLEDAKDAPAMVHPDRCREITIAKARFNGRSRGSKVIYSLDGHTELYAEYTIK